VLEVNKSFIHFFIATLRISFINSFYNMNMKTKSTIANNTSSVETIKSDVKVLGKRSRIWRSCRKGERKEEKVYDDYDEYDFRSLVWDSESNPIIASCYHNQKLSHCEKISSNWSTRSEDKSILRDVRITDVEFRSYFIPLDDGFDSSVIYSDIGDDDLSLFSKNGNEDTFSDLNSSSSYSDIDDNDYSFSSYVDQNFFGITSGDDKTCSTASLTTSSESTLCKNHLQETCNDCYSDGKNDDGDGGCWLPSPIRVILNVIDQVCNQRGDTMLDSTLHTTSNGFRRIKAGHKE